VADALAASATESFAQVGSQPGYIIDVRVECTYLKMRWKCGLWDLEVRWWVVGDFEKNITP